MPIVREIIDALPFDETILDVARDEELLLTAPPAPAMKLWHDCEPLPVYRFPAKYEPVSFAPPRGMFEGPSLRLEWQTINGRQPFYHRNTDVDELSFQVCGERTLMTEFGTVELRPDDFTGIPVGVAHDNFGREDIHLLFYLPGPAKACVPASARSDYKVPPFEGWQPKRLVEVTTECLGAAHCDVAVSLIDEGLLLKEAQSNPSRLEVLRVKANDAELAWVYKAPKTWIGHTTLERRTAPRRYTCHRRADVIQYQVSGRRTLITQRGTVTLDAGEFVCIPFGCAFASVSEGASRHISVLTSERTKAVPKPERQADLNSSQFLAAYNSELVDA